MYPPPTRQRQALLHYGLTTTLCCGCAVAQTRHHDALVRDLAKSEPAPTQQDRAPGWTPADEEPLDRARFVRAVLDRNPSIAAAREAWRASVARYPQTRAIEDPMVEYAFAPLSIGSRHTEYGQSITVRQNLPWPGKLVPAGESALAEAEAMREDYHAMRLELALAASRLFDAYFAAERGLEIIEAHAALVQEIGQAALAQYETGRGSAQAATQAEIEAARVELQRIELHAERNVVVAQMNALLHRAPEEPLPPPPARLEPLEAAWEDAAVLQSEAVEGHPQLLASQATVRGRASAVRAAQRGFYPNVGLMATYSTMWPMPQHRWMMGVALGIPLQIGPRRAAVAEASALHARAEHALQARQIDVRAGVEQARQRLLEAQAIVQLHRERLIPAARQQIETAQVGYATGSDPLETLLMAERTLRDLELSEARAHAEVHRRHADLWRAVGRMPGLDSGEAQR